MKIRKLQSKQILSLYLLKSKTYEQFIEKNSSKASIKEYLNEILLNLKKALRLIFQYHVKNKFIVFIGLPDNLRNKINKLTRHKAFPKQTNLQNVILHGVPFEKSIKNFKSETLKHSVKKPSLVVVVEHVELESIIKESFSAKIPVICINSNHANKSFFYSDTYKVSISQNVFQPLSSFFFVGLSFLFKK